MSNTLTANLAGSSTGEMTANLSGIGATVPRADWTETNPKKPSYILNKTLLVVGGEAPEKGPAFWFCDYDPALKTGQLVYIGEDGSRLLLNPMTVAEGVAGLAEAPYETVQYGISGGVEIEEKALNAGPLYCVYTDEELTEYYIPLMSWDRATHTAYFGGCYGGMLFTLLYQDSRWSMEKLYLADAVSEAVTAALTEAKANGDFDGEDGYTPQKGKDYFDGKDGKSAYQYAKEAGYTGTEQQFAQNLANESDGFETVAYGASNGHILIENKIMNGLPLYCRVEDEDLNQFFVPLADWDADTQTASFGACYGDKIITVVCAGGAWSKSEMTLGESGSSNVFIGTEQTAPAEYQAAFDSGKACFLFRDRGSSKVMYTVYQVTSGVVHLARTASSGLVEYGYLNSSGTLGFENKQYATEITDDTTKEHNFVPTAKAVKAAIEDSMPDLTGYAKESWVQDTLMGYAQMEDIPEVPSKVSDFQNDAGYATQEWVGDTLQDFALLNDLPTKPEDIGAQPAGDYLLSSALPTAINTALAQAKASGEFDGEKGDPGYTPVKGTDYFTAADRAELVLQVKASLTTENWTFTLADGSTVTKAVYIG